MSQFTTYENMYNIPQDTLMLSKDQALAKVSIAHVLRQADRFSEYQNILLFQKELFYWYKELNATLDDCFYANAKYREYKEHISNLVLNSNAMSNMPIFGAQTNSFSFGLQSLSRSQLSEDQAVSQLKNAFMTIVSIVGKMKTAVGIHEQRAVPQPTENAVKGNKHNATSLNNNKIFIVNETMISITHKNWQEAINGRLVDFNVALARLFEDENTKEIINSIEKNMKEIDQEHAKISKKSLFAADIYKEYDLLFLKYAELARFASSPQGSLQSYSNESRALINSLNKSYDILKAKLKYIKEAKNFLEWLKSQYF